MKKTKELEIKEQEIKDEILKMSFNDIKINTKYIIEFEDFGQDFLEWYIDERGYVLDSQPFQRFVWAGTSTVPETAEVGAKLVLVSSDKEESYIKYPIKSIKVLPVKEKRKQ